VLGNESAEGEEDVQLPLALPAPSEIATAASNTRRFTAEVRSLCHPHQLGFEQIIASLWWAPENPRIYNCFSPSLPFGSHPSMLPSPGKRTKCLPLNSTGCCGRRWWERSRIRRVARPRIDT